MAAPTHPTICSLSAWLLLGAPGAAQAAAVPADLAKDVEQALRRARPVMLEQAKYTAGGQHALLCLALAHDGLDRKDPAFRAAIDRLARSRLARTYELSLRLMVLAAVDDFPERKSVARRDLAALLRNRRGGGFSYASSGGDWDLSNTQYAALGMRAAASLDVNTPRAIWQALARTLLASQVYRGGFRYVPRSEPTPSMTVAGIAVLEICMQQLNTQDALGQKMRRAIDRAWSYMAGQRASIGAGRGGMRDYYYHYGLERAAILSDRQRVADVDWYATGARMFLAQEAKGGGWGTTRVAGLPGRLQIANLGAAITTSFAVLFLRRKFQRVLSGPVTPARNTPVGLLPEDADEVAIRASANLAIARGYPAVPELLRAMHSPVLARRKVVALALPAITGMFHEFAPYAKPAAAAAVIKRAELWWLREGAELLGKRR